MASGCVNWSKKENDIIRVLFMLEWKFMETISVFKTIDGNLFGVLIQA